MHKHFKRYYILGTLLLVASALMVMASLAGIAGGISGAGNTTDAENLLLFSIGVFWFSLAILVAAVVLHLKNRAYKSTLNESDQPGPDDVDSR